MYWGALFVSTHVPIPPDVLPPEVSDKTMHYVAYSGLTFLVTLWLSCRRHLKLPSLIGILVGIALYGVIDELLQIPVQRNADFRDWIADLLGAVCGLIAFVVCRTVFPFPWRST